MFALTRTPITHNAPKLAVGDGAMGFWAALDEVYGATRQQRCWMHKMVNVMNCMPKSMQPKVKSALHEIWQAPTKDEANKAFDLFEEMFKDKYPKAVAPQPAYQGMPKTETGLPASSASKPMVEVTT